MVAALDGDHVEMHAGHVVQRQQLGRRRIERVADLEVALQRSHTEMRNRCSPSIVQRAQRSKVVGAAVRAGHALRAPAAAARRAAQELASSTPRSSASTGQAPHTGTVAALPDRAVGRAVVDALDERQQLFGVRAQQRRDRLAASVAEEVGVDAGLLAPARPGGRGAGRMLRRTVAADRARRWSRRRRAPSSFACVSASVTLLEDVDQSAEEIGREVHVDAGRLIVQQRHALAHAAGNDARAAVGKGCDLRWPGRGQACADQLLPAARAPRQVGPALLRAARRRSSSSEQLFRRRHGCAVLRLLRTRLASVGAVDGSGRLREWLPTSAPGPPPRARVASGEHAAAATALASSAASSARLTPSLHSPMPCGTASTAQRSTKPPISTSTAASALVAARRRPAAAASAAPAAPAVRPRSPRRTARSPGVP